MGQDKRKELIFQQKLFLDIVHEFLTTKPWVAYFAAVKHFRVLDANDVSTATFNDLRDKEFATEVASTAESLRDTAVQSIWTSSEISKLFSPSFPAARNTLSELASSKYHAAVIQAFTGQKPPSGCATVMIGFGVAVAGSFAFAAIGAPPDSPFPVLLLTAIMLVCCIIAYLQFSHWQSVSRLLNRFQSDVVSITRHLDIGPLDWLAQPADGLSALRELETKRKQLEDTFLVLHP